MTNYVDSFPGREICIKGTSYLYFGGTAYLGLQNDQEFQELLFANIQKYGTGYGASRLSNIRISVFEEVEAYLASWVGSESCLTLSSGYLAGQLIISHLIHQGHEIFYAPNIHSSLYKGNSKIYPDYSDLQKDMVSYLTNKPLLPPVLCLDTIDLKGNGYPEFHALQNLPLKDIILVADDSHGLGILGSTGEGCYKMLRALHPKELIVTSSLGKGLALSGGALFGSSERMQVITQTPFYAGASPASPAALKTLMMANKLYAAKRKTLEGNIRFFLRHVPHQNCFTSLPDHPVFELNDPHMAKQLEQHNIIVTHFKYMGNGSKDMVTRIVLSAAHTPNDIALLCEAIT